MGRKCRSYFNRFKSKEQSKTWEEAGLLWRRIWNSRGGLKDLGICGWSKVDLVLFLNLKF